jgi:hypothetical protein
MWDQRHEDNGRPPRRDDDDRDDHKHDHDHDHDHDGDRDDWGGGDDAPMPDAEETLPDL